MTVVTLVLHFAGRSRQLYYMQDSTTVERCNTKLKVRDTLALPKADVTML